MQKLYCFVDENGQDTEGRIFVVAVVILGEDKDDLFELCEHLEVESRKGKFKWGKAQQAYRLEYLRRIFANDAFQGRLCYVVFRETKDYESATIQAIARAVTTQKIPQLFSTLVYIDGLSKMKRQPYAVQLRRFGVRPRKVQGVTKDENNALVRLADAVAGFVRDVMDGDEEAKALLDDAVARDVLNEV